MLKGESKIKKVIIVIAFFLCASNVVFADVSVSTGVTISATVEGNGSTSTTTTPVTPPSTGNGGGGGSYFNNTSATVNFSGRAYPSSKVVILQDYVPVLTTVAGGDAKFSAAVSNLAPGNYNFLIYGQDDMGRRSENLSFPLVVSSNVTIDVSGVFIAPTIALDKTNVAKGDNITIFGQSVPDSNVVISVHSANEIFKSVATDKNGIYLYTLDTSALELGSHVAKSKTVQGGAVSSYGTALGFIVSQYGEPDISSSTTTVSTKGDFNRDGGVGIIDYSILTYWYGKSNPPQKIDLNHDGFINLVDFSILAYYWTGN